MEVSANIKYLRISVKKIKMLASLLVGLQVDDALNRLTLLNDKSCRILSDVIKSAKANAVNNHKLNEERLIIVSIESNKGPILKRWRAVSRGMAHSIRKNTSHIKIVLDEMLQNKRKVMQSPVKKTVETKEAKQSLEKEKKGKDNGTKN